MTLKIFERKYELDSILAVIKLSYAFWKATNDATPFQTDSWKIAMRSIMDVIEQFQKASDDGPSPYYFVRRTTVPTDTLMNGNGGPGVATGMSRSPFRPSDGNKNGYDVISLFRFSRCYHFPIFNSIKCNGSRSIKSTQ